MSNNKKQSSDDKGMKRREFMKGLATVPVFGGFAAGIIVKRLHDRSKQNAIYKELGIDPAITETTRPLESEKPGELIRIGLIGVGSRGTSILESLGYFDPENIEEEDVQKPLNIALTGVCDVYEVHTEKGVRMSQHSRFVNDPMKLRPARRYQDYRDMLDSPDIDAVIIATPDHWHACMVRDAVSAGKHVFCEKCLTRTIDEVYAVYDDVKNGSIVFQYGHQNRQQESYRIACEIIARKVLGKITLVKTHTNRNNERGAWIRHLNETIDPSRLDWNKWQGPAVKASFTPSRYYGWQKFFEYSGGLPPHMFSHEYDAINQVMDLGIPRTVTALGGTYYWKDDRNTPDVMQALFEYPERGMVLTYDATLASSSTGEYESGAKVKEIMGSDAWMKLSMNIHVVPDRHSKRYKNNLDRKIMNPGSPFLSYTPGGGIDAVTSASERYYASQGLVYTFKGGKKVNVTYLHVREWLDCIRNGGEPSCNIDRAFEDAITCLMATKSFQEKRRVSWDPVKRKVI